MENDESCDGDILESCTSSSLCGDPSQDASNSVDDTDIYFELGSYSISDGGTDAPQMSPSDNNTKGTELSESMPNEVVISNEENEDGECLHASDERKDPSTEKKGSLDQAHADNCASKKGTENSKSSSADAGCITRYSMRTILKEKNSAAEELKTQGKDRLSTKCVENDQYSAKKHNAHTKEENKVTRAKNSDMEFVYSRLMEIHKHKTVSPKKQTAEDSLTKKITADSDNYNVQDPAECKNARQTRKEDDTESLMLLPKEDGVTTRKSQKEKETTKKCNKESVRVSPRIQAMQALKLSLHPEQNQSSGSKNVAEDICNKIPLPSKEVCISDNEQTKASNTSYESRPETAGVLSNPFQAINKLLGNTVKNSCLENLNVGNVAASSEIANAQDTLRPTLQAFHSKIEAGQEKPGNSEGDTERSKFKPCISSPKSPRKKHVIEPQSLRRSPRKRKNVTQSLDLYEDFLVTKNEEKREKALSAKQSEIAAIQAKLAEAEERCKALDEDNKTLLTNMSSLWKTAMAQIQEKCNVIHKLERERESIIFRRAMRQVPRDELDRVVSRIAAYNNEEFTLFMESLKKESQDCTCGAKGKEPAQSKMTVKRIKDSVVGSKISDLTETQAHLLQLSLGKQGKKISTSMNINLSRTPKSLKSYQGKEENCLRYISNKNHRSKDKFKKKLCRKSVGKKFSESVKSPCNNRERRTDSEHLERYCREGTDRRKNTTDREHLERHSREDADSRKSRVDYENVERYSREDVDKRKSRGISSRSGRSEEEHSNKGTYSKSKSDHFDRQRKDESDFSSDVRDAPKDVQRCGNYEHSSVLPKKSFHSTKRSKDEKEFAESRKKSHTRQCDTHDNETDISFRSHCVGEDNEGSIRNSRQLGNQSETNDNASGGNDIRVSHQEALEASLAETTALSQTLFGRRMLKKLEMEKKETSVMHEEVCKVDDIASISEDKARSESKLMMKKQDSNQRKSYEREIKGHTLVEKTPTAGTTNVLKENQTENNSHKINTSYADKVNFREDAEAEMVNKVSEISRNAVTERVIRKESSSKKYPENHYEIGQKANTVVNEITGEKMFGKEAGICLKQVDLCSNAKNFIPDEVHKVDKKTLKNSIHESCKSNNKVFDHASTENENSIRPLDTVYSSEERSPSSSELCKRGDCTQIILGTSTSKSGVAEESSKTCELQTSNSDREQRGIVGDEALTSQSNSEEVSQFTVTEMGCVQRCHGESAGTTFDNNQHVEEVFAEGDSDSVRNLVQKESYYSEHSVNSDVRDESMDVTDADVNEPTNLNSSEEDPPDIEVVCEVIVNKKTLSRLWKSRKMNVNPVIIPQEITDRSSREMTLSQIQEEEKTLDQTFMETILDTIQVITPSEDANCDWVDVETLSDAETSEYSVSRSTKASGSDKNFDKSGAIREKDTENLYVNDYSASEYEQTDERGTVDEVEKSNSALVCPQAVQQSFVVHDQKKPSVKETSVSKGRDINDQFCDRKGVVSTENIEQNIHNRKELDLDPDNKLRHRKLEETTLVSENEFNDTENECVGKPKEHCNILETSVSREMIKEHVKHRSNIIEQVVACHSEVQEMEKESGDHERQKSFGIASSIFAPEEAVEGPMEESVEVQIRNQKTKEGRERRAFLSTQSRLKSFPPVSKTLITTDVEGTHRNNNETETAIVPKKKEAKEMRTSCEKERGDQGKPESHGGSSKPIPGNKDPLDLKNCGMDADLSNTIKAYCNLPKLKVAKLPRIKKLNKAAQEEQQKMQMESQSPLLSAESMYRNKIAKDVKNSQRRSFSPPRTRGSPVKPSEPQNSERCSSQEKLSSKTSRSHSLLNSVPQIGSQGKTHHVKVDRKLSPLRNSDRTRLSHSNPEGLVSETKSEGSQLLKRDGLQGRTGRSELQHRNRKERNLRPREKRRPTSPSPERPATRSSVHSKGSKAHERSRKRRRSPSPRRNSPSVDPKEHQRISDMERPTKKKKVNIKVTHREIFGTDDESEESLEQRPYHRSSKEQASRRRMSQRLRSKERHSPKDIVESSEDAKRKSRKGDVNKAKEGKGEDLDVKGNKLTNCKKLTSQVLPVDKKLLQAELHQLVQGYLDSEKEEGELDEEEENVEELNKNLSKSSAKVRSKEATDDSQSFRVFKNRVDCGNQECAPKGISKDDKGEKSTDISSNRGDSLSKIKQGKDNLQSTNSEIGLKDLTRDGNHQRLISETAKCVPKTNRIAKDKDIVDVDTRVNCDRKTNVVHSSSKPLKNLMEEETTFYPNDLYQIKGADYVTKPNTSSNNRASGSDDTIDMIMKKHNESWPQDVVNSSDDSEMSLLQFIDDKTDGEGERESSEEENNDQVREMCNPAGATEFFRSFDEGSSSNTKVDDDLLTTECSEKLGDFPGSESGRKLAEENLTESETNVNDGCHLELDLQLSNSLTSPGEDDGKIFQEEENNHEMDTETQSSGVSKQNEICISSHFDLNKSPIRDSESYQKNKEMTDGYIDDAFSRNIQDPCLDFSEHSSSLPQSSQIDLQELQNEIQDGPINLAKDIVEISQTPPCEESEGAHVSSNKDTGALTNLPCQTNLTPPGSPPTDEDSDSSDSGSSCSGCSKCGNEDSDSSSSDSSGSSVDSDSNIGVGGGGNLGLEEQITYPHFLDAEKSPSKSGRTPIKASHQSSHRSPRKTPCKTPRKTPCKKINKTPAKSSPAFSGSEKNCRNMDASGKESNELKNDELRSTSSSGFSESVKQIPNNFNRKPCVDTEHIDTKTSVENVKNAMFVEHEAEQSTSAKCLPGENAQLTDSSLKVTSEPVAFTDCVVSQKVKTVKLGVTTTASLIRVVNDENSDWSRPVTPAKEVEASFQKRKLPRMNPVEKDCPIATSSDMFKSKTEFFSNSLKPSGTEKNYVETGHSGNRSEEETIVRIKRKNVRRQLNLGFSTSDSSRVMVTSVLSTSPQKCKPKCSPVKGQHKEHDDKTTMKR